jgi:C-terminal processing protease CtpA/Prc
MPGSSEGEFNWARAPDLPFFLRSVTVLTEAERLLIITEAQAALAGYYVHLPDKCRALGVDPLAALDRLRGALPPPDDDIGFHAAMANIFADLRDLHTHYTLPEPYRQRVCLLPFKLADYVADGRRRVMVTELQASYRVPPEQSGFAVGVEIVNWNHRPIDQALAIAAKRSGGAHDDARRARALAAMTIRAMQRLPPPRDPVVLLTYRTADHAAERTTIFPWRVIDVSFEAAHPSLASFIALDHEGEMRRRANTRAYHPQVLKKSREAAANGLAAPSEIALPTRFPTVFKAHALPGSDFGYIRIFSFAPPDAGQDLPDLLAAFVDDFERLLGQLPPNGLVIDVRGNSGGILPLAESLLQTLSDQPITPQSVELRATPQVLSLCLTSTDLVAYLPSVEAALESGDAYSDSLPITDPAWCNGRPRTYFGPIVLLIDARCYSATDAFAAGFQDHAIGPVLGVSTATGAGGANVWELGDLLDVPGFALTSWPLAASLKLALRRTRRVGLHAGELLEGVGVKPDFLHTTTRADLLNGDCDLLTRATELLRGQFT